MCPASKKGFHPALIRWDGNRARAETTEATCLCSTRRKSNINQGGGCCKGGVLVAGTYCTHEPLQGSLTNLSGVVVKGKSIYSIS